MTTVTERPWQRDLWLYTQVLVAAGLGLLASLVLSVEAFRLAENPTAHLACNINAVLSCGQVGSTEQAHLFGFPNAFLGLITEPVLMTIAVFGLVLPKMPRWILSATQVAVIVGVVFSYWMLFQSVFVIRALCPWCLLVTTTTTLSFVAVTVLNVRHGRWKRKGLQGALQRALIYDLDAFGLVAWFLVVLTVIMVQFGSALFS